MIGLIKHPEGLLVIEGVQVMHYIIGIDDDDRTKSRGTGHLSRFMAMALAQDFYTLGVTRY